MNNQNYYTVKPQHPIDLVQAIKLIKPSVVKITIRNRPEGRDAMDPRNDLYSGSGFFINDEGYVITNYHVIEPFYSLPNPAISIDIFLPDIANQRSLVGSFNRLSCKIVAQDRAKDLALLKINQNPFKGQMEILTKDGPMDVFKIPLFCKRQVVDGERVAASGYPLSFKTLITTSGYIASSWLPNKNHHADMVVNHGNSGGPVYLVETGEIIGVAVSFTGAPLEVRDRQGNSVPRDSLNLILDYNSGISEIIGLENVREFLQLNNIPIK